MFLYWNGPQNNLVLILRKLIYLHSKNNSNFVVKLITPENINKYMEIPEYFYKMKYAHQADYVRINTIYKYGGIWLDSDTIVMDDIKSLFDLLETHDGFFIKENNQVLCNGVFGSKPQTPLLSKWVKIVNEKLEKKRGKIRWADIGSVVQMDLYKNNRILYENYKIFEGLDNLYPVNFPQCVSEYLRKPYDNYKTIIRDFQPLIILVNSVYKRVKKLSEEEIITSNKPLNYFINKSISNILNLNIPENLIAEKNIFLKSKNSLLLIDINTDNIFRYLVAMMLNDKLKYIGLKKNDLKILFPDQVSFFENVNMFKNFMKNNNNNDLDLLFIDTKSFNMILFPFLFNYFKGYIIVENPDDDFINKFKLTHEDHNFYKFANNKHIFDNIYKNELWNNHNQSIPISDPGSSIKNTRLISQHLDNLIYENNLKKIVDLGCGDLTWISKTKFFMDNNIQYEGYDICEKIINENKIKYMKFPNKKFIACDITSENFNINSQNYDLVILRDIIFHLPANLNFIIFEKIKNKFKYIAITSCNNIENYQNFFNIYHYNETNLFIEPFNIIGKPTIIVPEPFFKRNFLIFNHDEFYKIKT